jgi:hypothetical protein
MESMGERELLEICVFGLPQCSESKPCPMHSKYRIIRKELIKLFETETIRHLANDKKTGDIFIHLK